MAFIKWRGEHAYLCHYVGGIKVTTSLKTTNLKEAKTKLREWEQTHEQGGGQLTETPTVEVVDAYLEHVRTTLSDDQHKATIYTLRDLFGEISPGLTVTSKNKWAKTRARDRAYRKDLKYHHITSPVFEQIDTPMIADWLRKMVKHRSWSPATATKRRAILSAMWAWAMATHGVRRPGGSNPVHNAQTYKIPTDDIRFLTAPQIKHQLGALIEVDMGVGKFKNKNLRVAKQIQAMVAVYIFAGLRLAEVLHLTMADVELGDGVKSFGLIRVRAKSWAGGRWQPKTGTNRIVPISSDLYPYLVGYDRHPFLTQWYFPSPEGNLWSETNFGRKFRYLQGKADLEWTCLDFRHTFGSHLAQAGVSPFKIAKLMGNSEAVVRKHYAALINENMTDEVEFQKSPQPVKAEGPRMVLN